MDRWWVDGLKNSWMDREMEDIFTDEWTDDGRVDEWLIKSVGQSINE